MRKLTKDTLKGPVQHANGTSSHSSHDELQFRRAGGLWRHSSCLVRGTFQER